MASEAEIRRDERLRLAALLEGSGDHLVDFTGASTLAVVELIIYLLRLDHSDEAEAATSKTITVCWSPNSIKEALRRFRAYRDGVEDFPGRSHELVQVAIDALRAAAGVSDG